MTTLKTRIERLEKLVAPPAAPSTSPPFTIVDLGEWSAESRAAYRVASEAEDWPACNRLMEAHAGIPQPSRARTRRRHLPNRPRRMVELVIDHLDAEPVENDEPDSRQHTLRDGTSAIVTGPVTPAVPDLDRIVEYDASGYTVTERERQAKLRAEAASGYQAFDSGGRPL